MIIVYLGQSVELVTAQNVVGKNVVYGYDAATKAIVYDINATVRLMIEANLHPVKQVAKLERTIEYCNNHWDVIITTHSRSIIEHLGSMIAANRLAADEVQINVLEDDLSAVKQTVVFDSNGSLVNWDLAFFDPCCK